jgi:hypothetical protein
MGFILSTKDNTYGLVKYEYACSADYKLFLAAAPIGTLPRPLVYRIVRHASLPRAVRQHLLKSVGPPLVSDELRQILERLAPADMEFFPAKIRDGEDLVGGFSAMNVLNKRPCIDMEQSEYKQTNFDPSKPTYSFDFYKIDPDQPYGCKVALAQYFPELIVVDDTVKAACFAANLVGLAFASAVDLTHGKRGVVERIKQLRTRG